ncbi:MAG: helicase-associated domain-containing protein [Treponema sp.]|jgi:hypothetical protein|nr:helicase-associated domain-containing protein [Treponema sp.]
MMGFPWSGQKTFRSVDEWKSAFMTLPDNIFYELVRSILGNIKTPFSKQRLLNDLVNLLSRDEIRKIIAAYIDGQDHKIITAVAFLDEPVTADLEAFFTGEYTPAELHALLINLEERLILYRLRSESGPAEGPLKLALNPILEPVLAPFIGDIRPLFASHKDETPVKTEEADGPSGTEFRPDDRTMAALFAFIQGEEELFKAEAGSGGIAFPQEFSGNQFSELRSGELRKKVLDEWKKLFPRLELELSIRILLRLGLLRQKGRGLVPCNERMTGFCELPAAERQEYWAAGIRLCLDESKPRAPNDEAHAALRFSWNRLRRIASFIHSFRLVIDPERVYPETTLRRLWDLLTKEKRLTGNAAVSPFFYDTLQLPFEELLEVMEKTGFLARANASGKNENCWKALNTVSPNTVTEEPKPVIVMDAAFSFVLYPEISFADAVSLGAFCSVKENTEAAVRFEVTRQSVVRGFDQGLKAEAMIALLERLSLNRLDANLGWTLREWEKRYTEVSLYQGIVLVLEENRRYLADAGPISHLIRKTLAPGVYLLSAGEKAEAARALLKAGVDIVAQPPLGQDAGRDGFYRNAFTRLGLSGISDSSFRFEDNEAAEKTAADSSDDADAAAWSIKQSFRQALEKTRFTKAEKDELIARIERRLILSEAQLEGTSVRYEKLEARGLDYAGKSSIAKQAVESGYLVEVTWPGPGGELKRTAGIAQALEKKEGDSIFVFRSGGDSENDANVFRVPLGKISLLRRIKQSIFEE